jgi:hypothetical protein
MAGQKLEDICSDIASLVIADASIPGSVHDAYDVARQKEIDLATDTARSEIKRDTEEKKEEQLNDLRREAVEAAKGQMRKAP